MQVEIITDPDKIAALRGRWDHLFDSGIYEPSTAYEWVSALLSTSLSKTDSFFVMVLKESNDIVGIIPLVIACNRAIGLRTMFPIFNYYNTHGDLLIERSPGTITEALIEALFNLEFRWDIFRVARFKSTNPIIDCLKDSMQSKYIRYELRIEEPSFYISLKTSYDEYIKQRTSKFRNNLKRWEKKIMASGNIKFCKYQNPADIPKAFDDLLFIESRTWKHENGTAISSKENHMKLYRILCEEAAYKGWVHLFFLYIDDSPVAYSLGLVINRKYNNLKTSYSAEYKKIGPSSFLKATLINELMKEGIEEFDFIAEPYEWQKQWTDKYCWHKSLVVYNDTFRAKIYPVYSALKKRKNKCSKIDPIRYHDPLDFKP